jgi:hypothetical protein
MWSNPACSAVIAYVSKSVEGYCSGSVFDHRSFVAFAVVLGVGHTDSLELNKH